jgi:sphinganine-1-phosphate aldolase
LGGFVFGFAKEAKIRCPVFDFRIDGVTSISADTHKYGYGPKGTSLALFRTPELRQNMFFTSPPSLKCKKGISIGLNDEKSGGLIAATWGALLRLSREGYGERVAKICSTVRFIRKEVKKISEVYLLMDEEYDVRTSIIP